MDQNAEALLRAFQCDYNRELEENFAKTLCEDDSVRLFFINEDRAYTDGQNIVVDPAHDGFFADDEGLKDTCEFLKWPPVVLADRWNALRIVTRSQTVHECLHIIYSDFPPPHNSDPMIDTRNRRYVMSMISNIVEDAYIESVGSCVYDYLDIYLKFGRVACLFARHPSQGTVERVFEDLDVSDENARRLLTELLDYMATLLLYPMVEPYPPDEALKEYIEATRPLFLEGSMAPSPGERYGYCQRIFQIILPLIPEDSVPLDLSALRRYIGDAATHGTQACSMANVRRKGRAQAVTLRLFADADGRYRESGVPVELLMRLVEEYARQKQTALSIVSYEGFSRNFKAGEFDCAVLHRGIRIQENHPKIDLNLRKAYQNIYSRYKININSYNSRFLQLLKARVPVREDDFTFGAGIASRRLGDVKKRYWYRDVEGVDLPDMAIMLLIDGSGSMHGPRREGAMISAVILHEVLKKQGVEHCIVEHRAIYDAPEVEANILVDFNAREEEKYNLMRIKADDNTRDGLALYWAERYLSRSSCERKVLIVLSDGVPEHAYDDYFPPVSVKDTANAVRKITQRGTDIIAVSLDDPDDLSCYSRLKEIYPNLIACNDLKRLTSQILGIIARLM